MKRCICAVLCTALLMTAFVTTVHAETGVPADLSRDGEVTLSDASRLFNSVAGHLTLSAVETALADSNRNGAIDLSEAVRTFYHVNGAENVLPEAVAYTPQYMDVSDGEPLYSEPLVFLDRASFSPFIKQHTDVSYYSWMRTYKNTDKALIAVPMTKAGYVASVSAQGNVLDIAVVTPSVPQIEHTAYAFLEVEPAAVEGKDIRVTNYADTSGKAADPTQTVIHESSGHGYSCTMNEDGKTATFRLDLYMSTLGYDITDMSYIATDDALIVIYDLLVPHRTHGVLTAMETITATMTIDAWQYRGQPIVLYERTRECYEPLIGSKMPFKTVYEERFSYYQPAENSVQLITSLEQLEQAYADDTTYAPDYTEGFTADYFEDHALILVKAYAPNLPEAVEIDGLGISGETITVSILYTYREWYQPMLYHGRILLEINAADGEDIETIRCQSHNQTI